MLAGRVGEGCVDGVTQMVTCTRLQLVTADGPGNSVEPSEPKQHGQEKSHGSMTFFHYGCTNGWATHHHAGALYLD